MDAILILDNFDPEKTKICPPGKKAQPKSIGKGAGLTRKGDMLPADQWRSLRPPVPSELQATPELPADATRKRATACG